MIVDIDRHREILIHLVPRLPVRLERYAIQRMEYGRSKYEKPGLVDNGRNLLAEAIEELVDGLNRLVMKIAHEGLKPDIENQIVCAAESIEEALRDLDKIKTNSGHSSL